MREQEAKQPVSPRRGYFTDGDGAIPQIQAGIWRHYKGGYYQVLGVGAHSETDELMVVYISLNGIDLPGPRIRIRPLSMWFDTLIVNDEQLTVHTVGSRAVRRFVYVGAEISKTTAKEEAKQP